MCVGVGGGRGKGELGWVGGVMNLHDLHGMKNGRDEKGEGVCQGDTETVTVGRERRDRGVQPPPSGLATYTRDRAPNSEACNAWLDYFAGYVTHLARSGY